MQEGWQTLHNEEDGNCENSKEEKDDDQEEETCKAPGRKADVHHHGPQHLRQLCKWQNTQMSLLRETWRCMHFIWM